MRAASLNVFISYAHEDEAFRMEFGKWLRPLERDGLLKVWHDRHILAGEDWADVIESSLATSDLVLLLISPDFMASEYCFHIEMAAALDRHNRGTSLVVPIFARDAVFSNAPFAKLQGLPRDAVAVASWKRRADAFKLIVKELKKAARLWAQRKTAMDPRVGEPAQLVRQDAVRMREYYQSFLRPAFSVPCIFEGSLQDFSAALDSLTEALATGKVMNRNREIARQITPLADFSTNTFRNALQQVLSILARTRSHTAALTGTLEGLATEFSVAQGAGSHMEFFLVNLLSRRAPRERIKTCIALMSEIDAQRNAVIRILNYLFELSEIQTLPSITLSADLLHASRAMAALGIAGSWTIYYLREAAVILADIPTYEDPEQTKRARLATVEASDYEVLARHIENQLSAPNLLADPGEQAKLREVLATIKRKPVTIAPGDSMQSRRSRFTSWLLRTPQK